MTNYISKTKAINKLEISNKIFDWMCYLNRISGFNSRIKQKKIQKIYFLSKDIKKIKKDSILFRIRQIESWKMALKNFRNKKKSILLILKHIPYYSFDEKIKEKFLSFEYTFIQFKNLFSFLLLITNQISDDTNNVENFQLMKENFLFFLTSIGEIKKIFLLKDSIQLQIRILNEYINLNLPKKKLIIKKKKYNEFLSEHYICLFSFILKKLIIFYNYKYVNCSCTNKFNELNSILYFSKRNYIYIKKKIKRISILNISKKYQKITQFFKISNFRHGEFKNMSWSFSKNMKLPDYYSKLKNFIFYIHLETNNNLSIFFLKCLVQKFLLFKNQINITHIICKKINKNFSLISQTVKLAWITNIINANSCLPGFFSKLHDLKNDEINPFYAKIFKKKKTTGPKHFRNAFEKKKIKIKEVLDMSQTNWIIFSKKKKNLKTKHITKKMIIAKIGSIFI